MDFLFVSNERIRKMNQADRSNPMSAEHRVDSLKALILSLILAALGTLLLLSILSRGTVVSASQGENTLNDSTRDALDSIAAATASTGVQITKTVEPTNPDTGGIVTICFTIGGLGPQRVDVVLAQDVSGSMGDPVEGGVTQTRLAASQAAACAFVSSLPSVDRAAVVSYSTAARLAQPLTTTKSSVIGTIRALTVTGGTNIGEGISVSHRELMTSPRYLTYTAKTIILLSDGIATEPSGYPGGPGEYARDRARSAATDTIKIYTIGFGSDADEKLLQDLANIGGGRYFFAPDADVLETIYMTIALELHNLVIVDLLPPGVDTDCSQLPDGWCTKGPSGVTTITYPISNSLLISDPAVICFTATVNLDPGYHDEINLPGSKICYQDSEGQTICEPFENPTVTVSGRKIAGYVFYDANTNLQRDAGEAGIPDVVVRTTTGLTTTTDISGSYVLRTSSEPPISVTVEIPPGSRATTPISRHVPPLSGTYLLDFGIYEDVCVQGKVFNDVNANGQDDGEQGLAGATIAVDSVACTTGYSGTFFICAPLPDGPVTIVETDPAGYTSTVAIGGAGVRVVDVNTLQIDSPVAGSIYGGNAFGDVSSTFTILALEKNVEPATSMAGERLTYTLIFANVGGVSARAVVLTDTLPSSVTLHYASPSTYTQPTSGTLRWDIGDIAKGGAPQIMTVVVTVSDAITDAQWLTNTARIVAENASPLTAWSTVSVVPPPKRRAYLPVVTRKYPPVIIVNGGFEDRWTGWTHGGKLAQTVTSTNPASGGFSALLGDPTYECEGGVPVGSAWVEQTVVIPSSVTSPTLYFKYNIFTQDKNPYLQDKYDRFDVRVGNTLVFSDARRSGDYGCTLASKDVDLHWKDGKVDLSAYSGQQITIRFENRSTSDYEPDFGWYNTWTFVDNVRVEPANGW
jgi:uncharacterized repeat protein (TIGR01451 family)